MVHKAVLGEGQCSRFKEREYRMDSEHVVERGVVLVVIVGRRHLATSGKEIGDITGLLVVCEYSQSVLLEGDGILHHLLRLWE